MDPLQKLLSWRRHSLIPCEHPDPSRYPLYRSARRAEIILNEGDALFIPRGWFHFVFSLSPDPESHMNIAVSCFSDKKHCDCQLETAASRYHTDGLPAILPLSSLS
ncbi:hypothetical protein EBR03_09875 [bacterium]|nr:hypothetical protein [bacterium]